MSESKKSPAPSREAEDLKHDIEHTRAEMAATVASIERRLDPTELREKAVTEIHEIEAKVKEVVREQLHDAKLAAKQELVEAKTLVKHELLEAKDAVKEDLQVAFRNAKQSLRDATFGKLESFATTAGDTMNDSRETLVETIKLNPIPAAVVGIGIAWLLMNRSSASRRRNAGGVGNGYPYGGGWQAAEARYGGPAQQFGRDVQNAAGGAAHSAGQALHQARDAAGQAVQRAGDAVGQVAHRAQDVVGGVVQGVGHAAQSVGDGLGGAATAVTHALHDATDAASSALQQAAHAASQGAQQVGQAAGQLVHGAGDVAVQFGHGAQQFAGSAYDAARGGAVRVERGFESVLEKNPMALGAAVLLVGAAVGYSLPRTAREDALLGGLRDTAIETAAGYAQEATKSLEQLAGNVVTSAKQAASQA